MRVHRSPSVPNMPGVYAAVEQFVREHETHGSLSCWAREPSPDG